jgi:UDP-2,4-diacetamido-2,4,6-trideoxy-beta-L-altropyranose hydrolase
MKIVFRTDASLQIGTGHVMRCLTLAEALKAGGAQCHFICREHPGNLIEHIRQRGFAVFVLAYDAAFNAAHLTRESPANRETPHYAWLGADWAFDAAQTKVAAGEMEVDWLIVDHYGLDARWEQALRPTCRKLMVIDDLADRRHECDLLLDQNLGRDATNYNQLVSVGCTVLVGPRYALLRPEFAALREYSLQRRAVPHLEHLLIAMGGVDLTDATGRVLEALRESALPEATRITIVMGPHAPWLEHVRLLAAQMPQQTEVKVNVQNMAQLMADSDLAIGAAGSTSWERCCLGLPSIIGVLADNQELIADALQRTGAAKVFKIDAAMQTVGALIEKVLSKFNCLPRMIASAAAVTDGNGAHRTISKLHAIGQI